ncbi:hypothetical protein [uncultured Pseudoalteromonas sp.]|uniref:hypothetical protein n=2 Tax=Pseudoalteromonas TaxID=53246 RepID=UPI00262A47D0|nr:hypothetical protein [uncultured Pseudoalteromonas sp.]|tara:strand:- start:5354 stop:5701 length:348 start_codon:yes stop_codon:yes gene_type:complete
MRWNSFVLERAITCSINISTPIVAKYPTLLKSILIAPEMTGQISPSFNLEYCHINSPIREVIKIDNNISVKRNKGFKTEVFADIVVLVFKNCSNTKNRNLRNPDDKLNNGYTIKT